MKIVTAVVNNPGFIEIQYHTFKKYLLGLDDGKEGEKYEFIVFNDAKTFPDTTNGGDITIRSQIEETCRSLGIQCVPIPNEHHVNMRIPIRHADTFNNHVLKYQQQNPDKYLLIDSDMFLIDYLDLSKTYFKYDCAVVLQQRPGLNYIWPGLCYLDYRKIKNVDLLDWREGRGGDVGGEMCDWFNLQNAGGVVPNAEHDLRWGSKEKTFHNEAASIYYIRHLWSCSWNENELPAKYRVQPELIKFLKEDVRNVKGNFYCEIYDEVFLHYRAGSNWNEEGMDMHKELTNKLRKALLPDNL